jgi:hypothetical protein
MFLRALKRWFHSGFRLRSYDERRLPTTPTAVIGQRLSWRLVGWLPLWNSLLSVAGLMRAVSRVGSWTLWRQIPDATYLLHAHTIKNTCRQAAVSARWEQSIKSYPYTFLHCTGTSSALDHSEQTPPVLRSFPLPNVLIQWSSSSSSECKLLTNTSSLALLLLPWRWRRHVPPKYRFFYNTHTKDGILHSHRREYLKSYISEDVIPWVSKFKKQNPVFFQQVLSNTDFGSHCHGMNRTKWSCTNLTISRRKLQRYFQHSLTKFQVKIHTITRIMSNSFFVVSFFSVKQTGTP